MFVLIKGKNKEMSIFKEWEIKKANLNKNDTRTEDLKKKQLEIWEPRHWNERLWR